jgi:predicted transcriptional regulator
MSPRTPKGDKPMEKLFNLKISDELFQALTEAHWVLRKPMAEICRDAIRDYLKRKMPKDQVKKFGL